MDEDSKKFDLVIFGASGFTGSYVVEELVKNSEFESGLTWAVAGRNESKLLDVLTKVSLHTGKHLNKIPVLIVDVDDHRSLLNMAQKSSVVINCVGPFCLYGEKVVKACIEGKANHLDISGEPWYLETIQVNYNHVALDAGIYVLGGCAFESVLAELGVVYTRNNFDGDLNSIECFLDLGENGNGGTLTAFQSAVLHFQRQEQLPELRKKIFSEPKLKHKYKIPQRQLIWFSENVNKWCVTYPGTDLAVVNRTQEFLRRTKEEKPIQFSTYFLQASLLSVLRMIIIGLVFVIMSSCSFTASIMKRYAGFLTGGIFTESGPSRKEIEESSHTFIFIGEGHPEKLEPSVKHADPPSKKIITKITGPDAGYVTTPICAIQCALCVIQEKDKMPVKGGVYTPGIAFRKTTLIDRLLKRGIKFEVIDQD